MSGLALEGVTLRLERAALFAPLSFQVAAGTVTSVLGTSGSGKSSLLGFISGTQSKAIIGSGSVTLGAEEITTLPTHERGLGLLFQDPLLFPHLDVAGNLLFGLKAGGSRRARQQRINEALASVELNGFADRDPATLSGGQKSRVALLRVLLSEPRALLLDEPFSALDETSRDKVRALVFAEAKQRNLPTLLVTHDEQDVAAAGGAVVRLRRPDQTSE